MRQLLQRARQELRQIIAMQDQLVCDSLELAARCREIRPRGGAAELARERRRIGMELHTGIGQALAGISIHLKVIEESLENPAERVRASLERAAALVRGAMDEVQIVSRRLYSPAWQRQPLDVALRRLWEDSGIPERFEAVLEIHKLREEPPAAVRAAIYHAAREAISNIIRHSRAHRVRLSLREEPGRTILEVADDGEGFSASSESAPVLPGAGIGLSSIRELARELGGDLDIKTSPRGTTLTLAIPRTR